MPQELLTEEEHDVIDLLGRVAVLMLSWASEGHPDRQEIAAKVHDLQNMVLSQAAARAYPDRYRAIGKNFDGGPFTAEHIPAPGTENLIGMPCSPQAG